MEAPWRLSDGPVARVALLPSRSHACPWVDGRRELGSLAFVRGLVLVNRNGPGRRDASAEHGPKRTLCNRRTRESALGAWGVRGRGARPWMAGLAAEAATPRTVMIEWPSP